MNLIKLAGVTLIFWMSIMFGTDVFAMDYDALSPEQKTQVETAATLAGENDPRTYYERTIAEEISKTSQRIKGRRIRAISRSLSRLTDDQLTRIEAIVNE